MPLDIRRLLPRLPAALAIAVTALGLGLRIEHAVTFDGPRRGADYAVHIEGVRWMIEHRRPFDFAESVSPQVSYQPPLWFALGGVILHVTHSERAIAVLSVAGWLVRQLLLALILREAIPDRRWSALAALGINAVLPLGVLTDGNVNPEPFHTTLFMVAAYALWRMEREANRPAGISVRTAVLFGVWAGLAVLAKATAGVLLIAAFAVLAWRVSRQLPSAGPRAAWRRLIRPAAVAGAAWCLVAGWWCGPNLWKYKHPFPHAWDVAMHSDEPVLYRRPLGWILPFQWKEYAKLPVLESSDHPRQNFWATSVTGTWTDVYNRGFCRLPGRHTTDHVWGAHDGTWGGEDWNMTLRCVRLHQTLFWIGALLTVASVAAVARTAANHLRTEGRCGSLVLPVAIVLVVFFVMLFALVYPRDDNAVLNPRYLLPAVAPMSACLGIALGELGCRPRMRMVANALVLVVIAAIAALVVFERFGR